MASAVLIGREIESSPGGCATPAKRMYAFQMGSTLKRREFLIQSVAWMGLGRAQTGTKLDRVSVMTSYFGTRMPDTRDKGAPAVKKDLDILDFPEMIADHFRIHHVEVQQMYFPSTEP